MPMNNHYVCITPDMDISIVEYNLEELHIRFFYRTIGCSVIDIVPCSINSRYRLIVDDIGAFNGSCPNLLGSWLYSGFSVPVFGTVVVGCLSDVGDDVVGFSFYDALRLVSRLRSVSAKLRSLGV